ncbi:unnamed protein product, partial [marine sediment metagenome]
SYLHSKGYNVSIIDANNFRRSKDFFDRIKTELDDALCAGLSVMSAQIPDALEIAKSIRAFNASLPLIWGGIHPTLYPGQTAQDSLVDFVVKGEGEITTLELVEAIEGRRDFRQVKGIAFLPNSGHEVVVNPDRELMDIEALPPIEWNLLENVRNNGMAGIVGSTIYEGGIPVQTSRGCPHHCAFCINTVLRSKYRYRQPASVLDDIKELVDSGVNRIYFMDENFFVNRRRLTEILDGIEKHQLVFKWFANVRVDYFREDYITRGLL